MSTTGADAGDGGSDTDDRAPLARGTIVGRYIVQERLGASGIGVVYAAYDPELAEVDAWLAR